MAFEVGEVVDQKGKSVFANARRANGFVSRARGLLFQTKLKSGEALWLENCNSVHCMGMHYKIDVVHLDINGVVIKIDTHVPPFGLSVCRKGDSVLEILAGEADCTGLRVGMFLSFHGVDESSRVIPAHMGLGKNPHFSEKSEL